MKPLIVANWKCNPTTLQEAKQLFNLVKTGIRNVKNVEIVICPPFIYLSNIRHLTSNIQIGAQDCFYEKKGAFTGEISPVMLKNFGCQHVILGHSERRRYFNETDEMINKKIKAALKNGLKPILCLEKTSQIKKDLKGISKRESKNIILAYEPVFAIGTGKPCSIEKAKKMRISMKKNLPKNVPILYGGSVNSQNAKNYISDAGFQGLLVGGASLDSEEFIKLVKNVSRA